MSISKQEGSGFSKVDRALEMQVIDWLQWSDFKEVAGQKHPAQLALEMISLRKKRVAFLEKELETAINLLKAGKRKFAPNTTNSDVDVFIEKHSGPENG